MSDLRNWRRKPFRSLVNGSYVPFAVAWFVIVGYDLDDGGEPKRKLDQAGGNGKRGVSMVVQVHSPGGECGCRSGREQVARFLPGQFVLRGRDASGKKCRANQQLSVRSSTAAEPSSF
jgi:hypothetical protein